MNRKLLIFTILVFAASTAFAQNSIFGKWKSVDDETGEEKSIVEIFKKNGKAYGKIIKILGEEHQNVTCDKCDDDDPRKDKRVIGMEIIKALEWDDDEWDGGTILDPEDGKVYKCKMWVKNGNLILRGYIGFSLIGRSQTWLPYK